MQFVLGHRWWVAALGGALVACSVTGLDSGAAAEVYLEQAPLGIVVDPSERDADGDGWTADLDCDDTDPARHPAALERCDGVDNDCDGLTDGQWAYDAPVWYRDLDGDGVGAVGDRVLDCAQPAGFVPAVGDCDDSDATSAPLRLEVCDGADNDCDGLTDESTDGVIEGCPAPPAGAEARCSDLLCDVACLPGRLDGNGDLRSPGSDGCEQVDTPVTFTDVTLEAGLLRLQQQPDYRCTVQEDCVQRLMTGGAAVADVNEDSLPDLFVTRTDAAPSLYLNKGDGTFVDQAALWGLADARGTNGAVFGDLDGDGDLDLFVSTLEVDGYLLYMQQDGTFVEQGAQRGVRSGTSTDRAGFSVAMGDYDRDGYLDLHVTEWRDLPEGDAAHAHLFRNRGDEAPGYFEDTTLGAGALPVHNGDGVYGYTSNFSDLDSDGWPDLVIAADFSTSQLLWNEQDGTFSDGTLASGVGFEQYGMGSAIGDFDGDGDLDWFVTSILRGDFCGTCGAGRSTGNELYVNEGGRRFSLGTDDAGVRDGGWAWGASFFDYDNDGDLDLVQAAGYRSAAADELRSSTRFWRNEDALFQEQAALVGLGDTLDEDSRAVVPFDYDEDGDLDLFVTNNRGTPRLYRNDGGTERSWLRVQLSSTSKNTRAIGARITVTATPGSRGLVREVRAGGGFLAQEDVTAHFGLGDLEGTVYTVAVRWPDGGETVHERVPANQTLRISR